jgi:hypothetical protein
MSEEVKIKRANLIKTFHEGCPVELGTMKPMNHQDIRLGHLLQEAIDAVKDKFTKETLKIEE